MYELKLKIAGVLCICFFPVFIHAQIRFEDYVQKVKEAAFNNEPFADSLSGLQYIVPSGHWIYQALYALSLEDGTVPAANQSPLTAGELERYFRDIDYDNLSSYGKKLYENAQKWFASVRIPEKKFPLNLSVSPSLNLALFYRNRDASVSYPEFDYRDIPPLLNFPLSLTAQNYAHAVYDLSMSQRMDAANSAHRFINIPLDKKLTGESEDDMDGTGSKYSYLSLGYPAAEGSFWNFKIGRGGINIGKTQTPSIILSDSMETATYAQFTLFGPNIKFSTNIMQLAVSKYLYFHALDFRLFKRLKITAIEGVMVNAPLELTYLNPVEFIHGLEPWGAYKDYNNDLGNQNDLHGGDSRVGSLFALAAELNPWKYGRLYALFQMNEFKRTGERKSVPNSLGLQGGLDVQIPSQNGYWIANLEGLWTSPYMYRLKNKNWSFCMNRRGFYGSGQFQWTGTPFGPDSIMGQITAGFTVPAKWEWKGFYRFLVQGELHNATAASDSGFWKKFPGRDQDGNPDNNTEKAIAMASVKTPSGIPQYTHRIGIEGFYTPANLPLKFKGYTGLSWIINQNNTYKPQPQFAYEAAVSCEWFILGGRKTLLQ